MSKTTDAAASNIILDAEAVSKLTTIARASWYRLIAKGLFPRPVRVPGLRSQRWKTEEVHAWLHGIIEQALLATGRSVRTGKVSGTKRPKGAKTTPAKDRV